MVTRSLEISKFVKTANLAEEGRGVEPMKRDTVISNHPKIKELDAYPHRKFVILKGMPSKTPGEGLCQNPIRQSSRDFLYKTPWPISNFSARRARSLAPSTLSIPATCKSWSIADFFKAKKNGASATGRTRPSRRR